MNQQTRLAYTETACSICWFIMDASWMFELPKMALVAAVPTVLLALFAFVFTEKTFTALAVSTTMAFWALMNVSWMTHDLDIWHNGLKVAHLCFAAGAICLASALLASKSVVEVMKRFRRLRLER